MRSEIAVELPGAVFPMQWWPDGSGLLARHEFEGRAQLLRLDPATGASTALTGLVGDIDAARIRPDGDVWYRVSDAVRPARILDVAGASVVTAPGDLAPAGRAYESRFAINPRGDRIHMFVVTPDGDGPFPTVLNIHGGPEWHERDRFDPETQAFVDAGYAVGDRELPRVDGLRRRVPRGAHRPGLPHRIRGHPGVSRRARSPTEPPIPAHVYWSGWSWGGCLACFHAGAHPDRFRAIFAGIPAGDFIAAHWASAPELQAWDDAVYRGSPDEAPDSYRQSDPMTYVDAVTAPVLVIAGEHDPRCPIEGITPVGRRRSRARAAPSRCTPTTRDTTPTRWPIRCTHMQWVLDFFARHR